MGLGTKTQEIQDQPEEQVQIQEGVLRPEAMPPSKFLPIKLFDFDNIRIVYLCK